MYSCIVSTCLPIHMSSKWVYSSSSFIDSQNRPTKIFSIMIKGIFLPQPFFDTVHYTIYETIRNKRFLVRHTVCTAQYMFFSTPCWRRGKGISYLRIGRRVLFRLHQKLLYATYVLYLISFRNFRNTLQGTWPLASFT